jgi:hypothetical protein
MGNGNFGLMRAFLTALTAAMTVLGALSAGQAQSVAECQQLWLQRNQIFKNRGYCFRTQAAVSYFGNAGCIYTNQSAVPLAASERSYIQQIAAREKSLRCQIDPGPPVQTFPTPTPAGPTPGPPTLGSPAPGPTAPGGPGDACKKFPGLC